MTALFPLAATGYLETVAPWFTTPFFSIFKPNTPGLTALVIALVGATGLWLGSLKIKSFSLGIPGTMFTGLLIARLLGGDKLNEDVINFVRDFGLIIFVYAVGVQVGPSFFATLRKRGLPLNLMAVAIVLLGAAISIGIAYTTGTDIKAAVGLFAGGTTNAPAIGSAGEALKSIHGADGVKESARFALPAFAIAYPFGLMGVILAMVFLRAIFRIDPNREADAVAAADSGNKPALATMNIELTNGNLDGLPIKKIPALKNSNVVVSRILRDNALEIAKPDTELNVGDVLLAVGPKEDLHEFRLIVGHEAKVDLRTVPSNITTRQILVTHKEVLGKTVDELDLLHRLGVRITRVSRLDIEFTAVGKLQLQFGDRVRAVGEAQALDAAAKELGDSVRELNHPRLLPIFIGIVLGVIVGSIPLAIKGLPAPVKLGLAAGPMIVSILLARIGRIGSFIWYMPHNASALLRELGIVLFLIAVGLRAGDGFFDTLASPMGMYLLGLGAIVTLVPLLIVGLVAQKVFKMNYLHVCGLLAGSMTSPSLAFTHTMTTSEAPAVAFATVYPLTMILRVLVAQLIVLIFVS